MFIEVTTTDKEKMLLNSISIVDVRVRSNNNNGCYITVMGFEDSWKERHNTIHTITVEDSYEKIKAVLMG